MDKEVSNRITIMSFTMAVLVVMIHSYNLNGSGLGGGVSLIEDYISKGLGAVANPGFFMVSGYLFYRSFYKREVVWSEILSKQFKRIRTLVSPYLVWNAFSTAFYMIMPVIINKLFGMSVEVAEVSVSNILLGIFDHKYNFPFWWLKTMISFVTIAPVLGFILKKKCVTYCVILISFALGTQYLSVVGVKFRWLTFYLLGAYLGVYHRDIVERAYSKSFRVIAILFLLISSWVRLNEVGLVLNDAILIVSPMALWISISGISIAPTEFMKQSFFMYASHILIVSTISNVLEMFGSSQLWILTSYLLTSMLSIAVIYILYWILSRYFSGIYRIVSGNR